MIKRGADLVQMNGQPVAPVLSPQQRELAARETRSSRPSPRLAVRTSVPASRSGVPLSAQQYGSASTPPPQSSRVRPRAGSMDGSYSHLTGPGGPPPSKRQRSDREYDRDMLASGHAYNHSVRSHFDVGSLVY